ncbi:MAG: STAS domain-containing protein [Acidobacteria bacterium]|nr:STAS domain-containing protein [Acidobacteriota bacterium]
MLRLVALSSFTDFPCFYFCWRLFNVPNPFSIQTAVEGGLSIISLEGFVDAHTAPQFENAVQSEIDSGRISIIVNCEKLSYISSAGLGVFMSFVEEVRDRGGDIKICGLVPKVKHTFEILGFQDIFEMLEDQPTAKQKFAAS